MKDQQGLIGQVLSSLGTYPPNNPATHWIDSIFGGGLEATNIAAAFSNGPDFNSLKGEFLQKGLKDEDAGMMALQEQQQRYNRMLTLMTQMLQMRHEGLKGIDQNIRA